jgi:hypothetical protein
MLVIRSWQLQSVALAFLLACGPGPSASDSGKVVVYRSPTCGCCVDWMEHLTAYAFDVEPVEVADVGAVRSEHGVPERLGACHTALVGGYFVEGHVPAEDVARLLEERPAIAGLSVPGMPIGSPGMEGPNPEPYDVLAVGADGSVSVFASHRP